MHSGEEGVRVFLGHACHGWGRVPALPRDVREIIYELTFPRIRLRCARCDHALLLESLRRAWFQLRSYTHLEGVGTVCLICLLPNESLLGQRPRYYARHVHDAEKN